VPVLSKAIETAMKMETDAIKFYEAAAQKTAHPFAKKMFEGFIKDEMRHLCMVKDILKGLDLHIVQIHPKQEIKTVFSELKDQMMERVKVSPDELSAVTVALDFEQAGYEFYRKAAAEATDPKEKELFTRLIQEEEEHAAILRNTYSFLKDTGDWFMWEERGILEG
jgi:rubrerythrin